MRNDNSGIDYNKEELDYMLKKLKSERLEVIKDL